MNKYFILFSFFLKFCLCQTPDTWVNFSPGGTGPSGRVFFTFVNYGDSIYLFGGYDGTNYYQDLQVFNLTTQSWVSNFTPKGTIPSKRFAQCSAIYENLLIIFGGASATFTPSNVVTYNFLTNTWTIRNYTAGGPFNRWGQSAVISGGQMYVYGGRDSNYYDWNDLYQYNISGETWSAVTPNGTPSQNGRYDTTAVLYLNGMYIFGGQNGKTYSQDFMKYSIPSNTWTTLSTLGATPSNRSGHTAVVNLNDEMVIFGGTNGINFFQDISKYSFATNTWSTVNGTGTYPPPCAGHEAVVTPGNYMYIFGGTNDVSYYGTLYKFYFDAVQTTSLQTTSLHTTSFQTPALQSTALEMNESLSTSPTNSASTQSLISTEFSLTSTCEKNFIPHFLNLLLFLCFV